MTDTENQTSYDEVPYGSHAFAQSHPDRLATIGRLFGMTPMPVTKCRVLELGCASGGNLTPMAVCLPESEFVGVDLSARQVEEGNQTIRELGLENIRIEHASILDVDASYGTFDYIISHGVFSWVPPDVQEKILAVATANLAPQGIVYISYNTYPGWHMREMLRHMMLYHIKQFKGTRQRIDQAKALIDFLARYVPTENNSYGLLLKNELELINRTADWYLFHDHLEEVNDPIYFHQFAERAGAHGLQYLGESDFGTMLASRLPKEAAETLTKINKNIIATEQYMDFLRNRHFRQTLLCHRNIPLKRNLGPGDINTLLLASPARLDAGDPPGRKMDFSPGVQQTFRTPKGQNITTNRPLTKAAMMVLIENWPRSVDFNTLFNKAIQRMDHDPALQGKPVQREPHFLATDMLQSYIVNVVELRTWQGGFVTAISERPKVSPLAAYQSRKGTSVVNLRHEQVPLDPLAQYLASALDGTRDRAAQFAYLGELIKSGKLAAQQDNQPISDPEAIRAFLEKDINQRLAYLARAALLVA